MATKKEIGCKCIDNLKKKMEKKYVGKPFGNMKKKVTGVSFVSAAFMFDTGTYKASGIVELTLEGVKKEKQVPFVYSYCPFCGKKYPVKDEMKQIEK